MAYYRRHPLEVTADRLRDHFYDELKAEDVGVLDEISHVIYVLDRIGERSQSG